MSPGLEASLAPPCSNLRYFGSNLLRWRKYLWYCWDFLASPQWFGARGIVPPFPPRYAPVRISSIRGASIDPSPILFVFSHEVHSTRLTSYKHQNLNIIVIVSWHRSHFSFASHFSAFAINKNKLESFEHTFPLKNAWFPEFVHSHAWDSLELQATITQIKNTKYIFNFICKSSYLWCVDLDLLAQLWLHHVGSFISSLLHSSTYPAQDTSKQEDRDSQCCRMLVEKPAQCPHKTSPKPAQKTPN